MSLKSKLYPPKIENKLPAFYGKILTIPFELNKSVSLADFDSIAILVKTVQNNVIKMEDNSFDYWYNYDLNCYMVSFDLSKTDFLPIIGQYYKVQIAFQSSNVIGYYSDIGVIKYTSKPQVFIKDKNIEDINLHTYEYTGIYSQDYDGGDIAEKVYSYCFNVYDFQNNLFDTSGTKLHNSALDTERSVSYDSWHLNKSLILEQPYYIEYKITTINGLEEVSDRYLIQENYSIDISAVSLQLTTLNKFENGYVEIHINGKSLPGKELILFRCSSKNYFSDWEELNRFNIVNSSIDNYYEDYSTCQGEYYRYGIRLQNDDYTYSAIIYNQNEEPVLCDFEDMFLYDGEKQLKIRFNPTVDSLKTVILESKVDTIGGKYPFIFRNGNVEYKEFSISGLLTFIADDRQSFSDYEISLADDYQLSGNNYYKEREFKLKVLDWLNNGKPKLFKSPAEGNYIVRLMNSSLTPNTTLGRMIHTFKSTAYEICDFNLENLKSYNIIKSELDIIKSELESNEKVLNLQNADLILRFPMGIYDITLLTQEDNLQIKCYLPYLQKQTYNIVKKEAFNLNKTIYGIECLFNSWGNTVLTYKEHPKG